MKIWVKAEMFIRAFSNLRVRVTKHGLPRMTGLNKTPHTVSLKGSAKKKKKRLSLTKIVNQSILPLKELKISFESPSYPWNCITVHLFFFLKQTKHLFWSKMTSSYFNLFLYLYFYFYIVFRYTTYHMRK